MLAQLNPVVGAIAGNTARAREAWEKGRAAGADMVALTEMFVTGYQTQDLILKPAFVRRPSRRSKRWRSIAPTVRRWGSAARSGRGASFTTAIMCWRAARFMPAS